MKTKLIRLMKEGDGMAIALALSPILLPLAALAWMGWVVWQGIDEFLAE